MRCGSYKLADRQEKLTTARLKQIKSTPFIKATTTSFFLSKAFRFRKSEKNYIRNSKILFTQICVTTNAQNEHLSVQEFEISFCIGCPIVKV